jgi:hypothetical protein
MATSSLEGARVRTVHGELGRLRLVETKREWEKGRPTPVTWFYVRLDSGRTVALRDREMFEVVACE